MTDRERGPAEDPPVPPAGPDGGAGSPGTSGTPGKPTGWRERLGLHALEYPIPREANRLRYMLGGLSAAFLAVLVLTGLYLAQFYDPTPAGAHTSVLYILTRAPLGDWVRSLHYWAAGAVVVTVAAHLGYVWWTRGYRRPREVTWWAGVGMAGVLFLLLVTGTALRYDQEGFEALAHFVAGGRLVGGPALFFTEGFTLSTTLLSRIYGLHTSLLPLLLAGLAGVHFWLIRHLGISVRATRSVPFRTHAVRLCGAALLGFAAAGALAVAFPEGLGPAPVAGMEVTKPFWPVLWVYGLENLMGAWGMVVGPAALLAYLVAVPLLDREPAGNGARRAGPPPLVRWSGLAVGLVLLGVWLYGIFGPRQQHLGM